MLFKSSGPGFRVQVLLFYYRKGVALPGSLRSAGFNKAFMKNAKFHEGLWIYRGSGENGSRVGGFSRSNDEEEDT